MGRRGPKPDPENLKILKGNPGRRPLNKREAKPDPTMPTCPAFLKKQAKTEWRRVARRLHDAGLLTYIDRAALAVYCQAYGRWVEAEEALKASGGEILVSDKNNFYHNPWAGVAKNAYRDLIKYAAEFGMTPSSRGRIVIGDSGTQKTLSLAETLQQAAEVEFFKQLAPAEVE